ncbi:MAG: hypothetical protein ACR2PL_16435 [Dehalococcoidia bacterium]
MRITRRFWLLLLVALFALPVSSTVFRPATPGRASPAPIAASGFHKPRPQRHGVISAPPADLLPSAPAGDAVPVAEASPLPSVPAELEAVHAPSDDGPASSPSAVATPSPAPGRSSAPAASPAARPAPSHTPQPSATPHAQRSLPTVAIERLAAIEPLASPPQPLDQSTACTSAGLSVSPASPQTLGASITLSATSSGCPQLRYRFFYLPPTGAWTKLSDWGSSASMTWNTVSLPHGNYLLEVQAKNSDVQSGYQAVFDLPDVLGAATACTGSSLNASPSAPQAPGASVTFSGSATGCTPEYRFWQVTPNHTWTVVQDWGQSPTYVWNTTGLPTGAYSFQLDVRNTGNQGSAQADTDLGYQLGANGTAPGTVSTASPATGASNQSPTLSLAWNAPSGSINGSTSYTVSLWTAGSPPNGHLLGTLPATTALSTTVPSAEQLLPGESYFWNVVACNAGACSGYNPTWSSFTIAP